MHKPLRLTGLATHNGRHAPFSRTLCERRSFAFQKAIFCTLKGHLLQTERRHIGNCLAVNALQARRGTHGGKTHDSGTCDKTCRGKRQNMPLNAPKCHAGRRFSAIGIRFVDCEVTSSAAVKARRMRRRTQHRIARRP